MEVHCQAPGTCLLAKLRFSSSSLSFLMPFFLDEKQSPWDPSVYLWGALESD